MSLRLQRWEFLPVKCIFQFDQLTFDISQTGFRHSVTEIDERPLGLAAWERSVVGCGGSDSVGSHV